MRRVGGLQSSENLQIIVLEGRPGLQTRSLPFPPESLSLMASHGFSFSFPPSQVEGYGCRLKDARSGIPLVSLCGINMR